MAQRPTFTAEQLKVGGNHLLYEVQMMCNTAALLEDARQGQRLEAAQGFQQKYLYTTVIAQVVGTSGTDQSRVIYINKGKNDGLARDMAVITADGIVGKVLQVFPTVSQVLLINDQSSGVGAILEKSRLRSAAFVELLRMIKEEEPPKPSTRPSASPSAVAPGSGCAGSTRPSIMPSTLASATASKLPSSWRISSACIGL